MKDWTGQNASMWQVGNETLKIPFNWFVCKESNKLKWQDLTGPEKLKLFQNIKIDVVLPNFQDSDKIQKLWNDFYDIAELLSSSDQDKIIVEDFSKRLNCGWTFSCPFTRQNMSHHTCMSWYGMFRNFYIYMAPFVLLPNKA
jgi:hypothetical protein